MGDGRVDGVAADAVAAFTSAVDDQATLPLSSLSGVALVELASRVET